MVDIMGGQFEEIRKVASSSLAPSLLIKVDFEISILVLAALLISEHGFIKAVLSLGNIVVH
jgi:hypothetical protein